jgi:hypothetical protein
VNLRRTSSLAAAALLATVLPAVSATSASAAPYCDPYTAYVVTSNTTNDMVVYDRYSVVNGTGSTITGEFRADNGGTVTASASISLSAEASAAVFAKVSATVNSEISKSMTASTGVTATSPVKPHSTLKGDYGIMRERVAMKRVITYTNCSQSTTSFSYLAPYRKFWKLYY